MGAGEAPSALALGAGYAALMAVNAAAGSGVGPVRSNKELSDDYPTEVTPAGWAFAIWGPIFLLQGGGTAALAAGAAGDARAAAAGAAWLSTWALENAWQVCFQSLPSPGASDARVSATAVPSAALLVGAHAAMLSGALALRGAAPGGGVNLLGALLVDLPTGLNAGWLAAASGIGLSLAARHAPGPAAVRWLGSADGGAALVGAVSVYGAGIAAYLGGAPHSLLVGVGYAAATAWACTGIAAKSDVAPQVAGAARRGALIAAAGGAVGLGLSLLALVSKK